MIGQLIETNISDDAIIFSNPNFHQEIIQYYY